MSIIENCEKKKEKLFDIAPCFCDLPTETCDSGSEFSALWLAARENILCALVLAKCLKRSVFICGINGLKLALTKWPTYVYRKHAPKIGVHKKGAKRETRLRLRERLEEAEVKPFVHVREVCNFFSILFLYSNGSRSYGPSGSGFLKTVFARFRMRIHMDPHWKRLPGSGLFFSA